MLDLVIQEWVKRTIPMLNETQRRWFLGIGADLLGRGGIQELSKISGVHRNTISNGLNEIKAKDFEERVTTYAVASGNVRSPGAGRKPIVERYSNILDSLESIVSRDTYGNPMNPLKWTTKSLRNIADELKKMDINISYVTVGKLLEELGYSLQSNRKMIQVGKQHPDRNAQFEHINATCLLYMEDQQPVVSIDCKKKENIGNFSNNEVAPQRSWTMIGQRKKRLLLVYLILHIMKGMSM